MNWLKGVGNFVTFGAVDRSEAKGTIKNAELIEQQAREELEDNRKETDKSLQRLGESKMEAYFDSLSEFCKLYKNIGKIDFKSFKKADDYINRKTFKQELIEMKNVSMSAQEVMAGVGASALGGGVAVAGALGLAGIIGTASTGTAIGVLSGAAAANATLAWLGGGAISAGGAGMAGGMLVLGGIAVVPLALIGMFMATKKAQQKLNEAKIYSEKVDLLVEKIKTAIAGLNQIQRGASLVNATVSDLVSVVKIQNEKMSVIVNKSFNRGFLEKYVINPIKKLFRKDILSAEEEQVVIDSVNSAQLLKKIIDMPLLNKEGGFLSSALEFIEEKKGTIIEMKNNNNLLLVE